MKLRRALAAAAATAAIAPAALLAAPAAYADTPEPTPSTTASSTSETPAPTPSATTDPAPSAPATTPAPTPTPTPTASQSTGTPTPTPTPTPSASQSTGTPTPSPTPTEDEDPVCEDESDEAMISTTLRGLPSKVVAGSGWVNFTFRATNVSDKSMKSVDAYVSLGAIDADDFDDVSKYLTVQWYDEENGWTTIDDEVGYFASIAELKADEYADAKLRLKVDAKTPGSYGFAVAIGAYHDEDDVCGFSEAMDYEFDVLVAGTKPGGEVPPAEGKPSDETPKPAPQGGLEELPVTGELAETGSSSALPTIAVIGGVAMVAGAGAIFVVRRRRTAGAAA
ncbi:LAETG motif-containing sortase-dependent surface protein [Streptomyces sp. NPDC018031]|uniref:LAETG motif-containing sortase-dependent surface protein n=1 Tax=Streptomyces sp. NPDC018031 TaxID=3365033 RepID=UPI0037896686